METHPHFVQFPTGRLVLSSPCSVGKEAFALQQDGNKYCRTCQKVVHDLTGMGEEEIKALFRAQGGKVCGTIAVPVRKPLPALEPFTPLRRSRVWKNWAAVASFLLLYQVPQVQAGTKPKISWMAADWSAVQEPVDAEPLPNTWISGLIVNQEGDLVQWDIPVSIYVNGKLHARVVSRDGLFSYDMGEGYGPETEIEAVVQRHAPDKHTMLRRDQGEYGAGRVKARLGNAQNLTLRVACKQLLLHIDGGLDWEDLPGLAVDENNPLKIIKE